MTSAWPRQCMATYTAPVCATTSYIASSARPPETSLMIAAPCATASRATRARVVSTLTVAPRATSASTTGSTRASSSSTGTRRAPGRVDSAPMSSRASPCATAAPGVNHRPPSENESGVTLTTPMTSVRPSPVRASGRGAGRAPVLTGRAWACTSATEHEAHRLGTRRGAAHLATHRRRHGARAGLVHAAHRHAQVLALDDDDDPARLEELDQGVRDLAREPLLHLGAPGEDIDEPCELAQPRDAAVRAGDVPDVRDPVERHEVVLARRVQLDALDEDHLVVAEVERRGQDVLGPLTQTCEGLGEGARDPCRGVPQALAVRVLADADEQLADGRLDARGVVVTDRGSV